jgi:hypothetical protein
MAIPGWHFGAYIDRYAASNAGEKPRVPVHGTDILFSVEKRLADDLRLAASYRSTTRERAREATRDGQTARIALEERVNLAALSIRANLSPISLSLDTRARTAVREARSTGYLVSAGVTAALFRGLVVQAGLTLFDSESPTIVSVYEPDVRLYFSAPSLSGQGSRRYLLLSVAIGRGLALEAKYHVTNWPARLEVGSGLDRLSGDRIREGKLQLRYSL